MANPHNIHTFDPPLFHWNFSISKNALFFGEICWVCLGECHGWFWTYPTVTQRSNDPILAQTPFVSLFHCLYCSIHVSVAVIPQKMGEMRPRIHSHAIQFLHITYTDPNGIRGEGSTVTDTANGAIVGCYAIVTLAECHVPSILHFMLKYLFLFLLFLSISVFFDFAVNIYCLRHSHNLRTQYSQGLLQWFLFYFERIFCFLCDSFYNLLYLYIFDR